MNYTGVDLKDSIHIDELFTVHYFEYMNDFCFEGEKHDFWEFLYVDKGDIYVTAGDEIHLLKKGDVIFHHPNQFHSVKATGNAAPNLMVVSFSCSNPGITFFRDKILHIDELERNLLAEIVTEAGNCFCSRLDDPYLTHMDKKPEESFGAEQILRLNLEYFLIHLIRRYSAPNALQKRFTAPPKLTKSKNDTVVMNRVVRFLEKNISSHVTIEQICRENLIGRTQLQKIFREKTGRGVIEYFSIMKIDTAKQLIRSNHMNFTQISEQLGYTSIHYFSRQFKKVTGMSPSEYASSIQAVAQGSFINKKN